MLLDKEAIKMRQKENNKLNIKYFQFQFCRFHMLIYCPLKTKVLYRQLPIMTSQKKYQCLDKQRSIYMSLISAIMLYLPIFTANINLTAQCPGHWTIKYNIFVKVNNIMQTRK